MDASIKNEMPELPNSEANSEANQGANRQNNVSVIEVKMVKTKPIGLRLSLRDEDQVVVVGYAEGFSGLMLKILIGDVISHINGCSVHSISESAQIIKDVHPGDPLTLTIVRDDSQTLAYIEEELMSLRGSVHTVKVVASELQSKLDFALKMVNAARELKAVDDEQDDEVEEQGTENGTQKKHVSSADWNAHLNNNAAGGPKNDMPNTQTTQTTRKRRKRRKTSSPPQQSKIASKHQDLTQDSSTWGKMMSAMQKQQQAMNPWGTNWMQQMSKLPTNQFMQQMGSQMGGMFPSMANMSMGGMGNMFNPYSQLMANGGVAGMMGNGFLMKADGEDHGEEDDEEDEGEDEGDDEDETELQQMTKIAEVPSFQDMLKLAGSAGNEMFVPKSKNDFLQPQSTSKDNAQQDNLPLSMMSRLPDATPVSSNLNKEYMKVPLQHWKHPPLPTPGQQRNQKNRILADNPESGGISNLLKAIEKVPSSVSFASTSHLMSSNESTVPNDSFSFMNLFPKASSKASSSLSAPLSTVSHYNSSIPTTSDSTFLFSDSFSQPMSSKGLVTSGSASKMNPKESQKSLKKSSTRVSICTKCGHSTSKKESGDCCTCHNEMTKKNATTTSNFKKTKTKETNIEPPNGNSKSSKKPTHI